MNKTDPKYKEMLDYFGSVAAMAKHFDVTVQGVYQWQGKAPETRWREYLLLKKLQESAA